MAQQPASLHFRRENHIGFVAAAPFTGSFTLLDPFVLPDGSDDALAFFQQHCAAVYADFAGRSAPRCLWAVAQGLRNRPGARSILRNRT
ncbi:MAG: hypothetical protein AB7F99_19125 [Vicinamibacterales bacterium]